MYRVIGADEKEYGPVGADEVRQWIVDRRLHANSLLQRAGSSEWQPLSTFPEFAPWLSGAAAFPPGACPVVSRSNSMAVTGLVMSCIALLCCGCAPLGVLGIVFSAIGLSEANRDPAEAGKGIAVAGIVIGIISLLGSVVALTAGWFGTVIEQIIKR